MYVVQSPKPTASSRLPELSPVSPGTNTHLSHTRSLGFLPTHMGILGSPSSYPSHIPTASGYLSPPCPRPTTSLLPLTWMTEAASQEDFLPPFLSTCQLLPTVARGNVLRLQLAVLPSKASHNFISKIKLFVCTDRLCVLYLWPHFLPLFPQSHD